jgi:hypothetical protein
VHGHCLMISGRARTRAASCRLQLPSNHGVAMPLISIGWEKGGGIVKSHRPYQRSTHDHGLQTSGIVAIDPLGRIVLLADSWQGASSFAPPLPCSSLST